MSQRGVTSEPIETDSATSSTGMSRRAVGGAVAVGLAVVLVAGCALWGRWLDANGYSLHLGNAWPVAGHWQTRLTWWQVVVVVGAGLWVWQGPRLARDLSWRRLLAVVFAVAACWPVALALVDGPAALTAPLLTPYEYLHDVGRVPDLTTFLSGFNAHVLDPPRWTTHVSGHPPGFLGLLTVMDRIGFGGGGPAAALCIIAGAAAAPATLSTTRVLGGEELARRAAPFTAMAPAALWIATSADAFFAGVAAVGVCLLAHAANTTSRRGDLAAVGGGLLLGASLFLSYGLALIGLLALGVVLVQRRVRPLLIGGAAVVALLAAAWLAGFNWFEGLDLATQRVRMGQGWIDRPAWYFWFANPAGLALAVGPAVVAALAWIRRDRFTIIPACVLTAVAVALVSGLSVGEAERIYLPFAVWLLPLAGLLPGIRWWLGAQAATAIAIATFLMLWW
ncbi:hypothetical protein FB566_3903 [Stackebrandtia endophytica]|uniref:Dolichyl-phosphate-mannose-protein mannosyltransferase n=1 Tax=Stackebrandtia endophytica TaxID=1496996 RepID=A0A543B0M4_9ACTN|nr:hypothetical protein [Stackebrandtia endophytica]TQL78320.1 hypothetical protein FB566_3903 [Stackebrandtia endophytica]